MQLSEVCMASLLLAVIYVAFISLGLPDPLLGSAWPSMYKDFGVDISFAGIIAMIIAKCEYRRYVAVLYNTVTLARSATTPGWLL